MLDQRPRNTWSNMTLWIAVAMLSMVGLAANVYKYNTGEPMEWPSTIAEIACLLAAILCVIDFIRKKRKAHEEKEK